MADQIGINLKNPRVTSLAGNAFVQSIVFTNVDLETVVFLQDVQGKFYGTAHIPSGYGTVTTAKVFFDILANATTGVTALQVSTAAIAEAESINTSLTAITRQDITVPGTALLLKRVEFSISTVPVADDLILIEFFHDGTQGADTLAVDTLLLNAYMELT